MSKIKIISRGDVYHKLYRLQKADGQTKDRVEVWRKNLHGLTDDLAKQVIYILNYPN